MYKLRRKENARWNRFVIKYFRKSGFVLSKLLRKIVSVRNYSRSTISWDWECASNSLLSLVFSLRWNFNMALIWLKNLIYFLSATRLTKDSLSRGISLVGRQPGAHTHTHHFSHFPPSANQNWNQRSIRGDTLVPLCQPGRCYHFFINSW